MSRIRDLTGKKFGKLYVTGLNPSRRRNKACWDCLCECGNSVTVLGTSLTSGNTKSCGCASRVKTHAKPTKYNSPEEYSIYDSWRGMLRRCENPHADSYKYYGLRGISVCEEWHDFKNFYDWALKNGWAPGLSIDRICTNDGYYPGNCRWADRTTQANNRSNSKIIEYNGRTQTLAEWCTELNLSYRKTYMRLYNGWSVERSFEE